jgi:hypothetical protein
MGALFVLWSFLGHRCPYRRSLNQSALKVTPSINRRLERSGVASTRPPDLKAPSKGTAEMTKMDRAGARVKIQAPTAKSMPTSSTPWLMQGVAMGAVGLSTVIAGVGVAGLVWGDSWLARLGTGVLIAGTLLTEIAASRLPVHAERQIRSGGLAGWIKGLAVVAGFAVLTAWNVMAAHFGMGAIDGAGVNDRRAPLEAAVAAADAARETSEEALAAFDAETARQQAGFADALRGAFQAGYVTAGTRSARASSSDTARAERRGELARDVSRDRAADRVAERALAGAPAGRPDHELWVFALVLELLKGALVWFATLNERRWRAPGAPSTYYNVIRCDPRTMTSAARRQLKSQCASLLATIRHLEAARA